MKVRTGLMLAAAAVLLLGCSFLYTGRRDNFKDCALQGCIRNTSYKFNEGYAVPGTLSGDTYAVFLHPESSAYDAEGKNYPYVWFFIKQDSEPQTYRISTFGTNGIMLNGYRTAADGVLFDKGAIDIISIDKENNKITGRIWAESKEKTSKISGSFEAEIRL